MELQKLIFLARKYFLHFLIWPALLAILVYFLSKDSGKTYESKTLIYAGFMSGYDIESSTTASKSSYIQATNSFDNLINIIKSRNTIEIVAIKLLTSHLKTDGTTPEVISKTHHDEFLRGVPAYILRKSQTMSYDELFNYLYSSMRKSDTSWVNVRFSAAGYYSYRALSQIRVYRLSQSDLFEISYSSDDPGVSKLTLDILNSVFIEKYTSIRSMQIGNVSQFFDDKLHQIKLQLKQKEDSLLLYKMQHNIVNYDDQTGQLTAKKDQLESMYLERYVAFEAAKSSLAEIESQLKARSGQLEKNQDIAEYRKEISRLSSEMMKEKLKGDRADVVIIRNLEVKQSEINVKLKNIVNEIGGFDDFVNGVNTSTVLDEWLQRIVAFEEVKAQLKAIDDYAKKFGVKFNSYAPIGAVLKKMEREIKVLEDEYLSLMNVYNQSRMKEHNLEKSLNIVALDAPFFPLQPVKSSRLTNVILALFAGFMIVLLIVFVKEILITKVNTIDAATRLIGGEILGLYPKIHSKSIDNKSIQRSENLIVQKLLTEYKKSGKENYNILVLSFHESDGKSYISMLLKDYITSNGITNSVFKEHDIHENNPMPIKQQGIHFHKILPLSQKIYNPFVLANFDCALMVVSSDMRWTLLEKDLISTFKNSFDGKFFVLLNNIDALYYKTNF